MMEVYFWVALPIVLFVVVDLIGWIIEGIWINKKDYKEYKEEADYWLDEPTMSYHDWKRAS